MKAYVLAGKDKAEWRNDIPKPEAETGEAIIKPVIVAPCTSDLHIMETLFLPHMLGKVLGHECAGIVEEVGEGVTRFKPGDKVVVPAGINNWRNPSIQDGISKFDMLSAYGSDDPRLNGCFAEYYLIKDADMNLASLPDGVSWEQAVVCSDMATTAFEAVDQAGIRYGQSVAIYGIGAVGLMAVSAAVLKGAARIFGVGSRQICFDVGAEFGVTDTINYRESDPVEQVLELNGGQVDVAIVCGGSHNTAIVDAMRMVRIGGTVVNCASFMTDPELTIPADAWAGGGMDKTIKSSLVRGGGAFLAHLLELCKYGRFHPEKTATPVFHGMDYIPEALSKMGGADKNAIKPVVFFDER